MPKRSTTDACFGLIQSLFEARNRGEISALVFLDLKKAFDTVNHSVLLDKLSKIGCDAFCIAWFRDYLSGRLQKTLANSFHSATKPITCGVPQGSVLGPLLFIIYINDVVDVINHCSFFLYADDLAIVVSGRDHNVLAHLLQDDLNNIYEWCYSNVLTVNI